MRMLDGSTIVSVIVFVHPPPVAVMLTLTALSGAV
jgi:hypothetical protein